MNILLIILAPFALVGILFAVIGTYAWYDTRIDYITENKRLKEEIEKLVDKLNNWTHSETSSSKLRPTKGEHKMAKAKAKPAKKAAKAKK